MNSTVGQAAWPPAGAAADAATPPGGAAQTQAQAAQGVNPAEGAQPCRTPVICSHAISTRLSQKLALVTMVVLGLLSFTSWMSVGMLIKERNQEDLALRSQLVADILALEARRGGETAVLARLRADVPMRANSQLQVWRPDGTMLYADPYNPRLADSAHQRSQDFRIGAAELPGGELKARYTVDFSADAAMGERWAWVLISVTLLAGAVVALGSFWHVRRALRPLKDLAAQTRAISPQSLHQRLSLADPGEELRPWIDQFNALMERLERAYAQLEGFNADVAHELRTPLANLIGETELALSRERTPQALRDTLVSNLEEMQRLSGMVNDMLFLASADRGAAARRGAPLSLAELARQVCEFHEAPLEDAGLRLRIQGDARVAVDEPLVKRALSNLLGNAARYADRGSTVIVHIAAPAAGPQGAEIEVAVINQGEPIAPQQLPRLFDRFFRGDSSRNCPNQQHHGLGLAIVAAIARMHAGRTVAECHAGQTRVGFTLAAETGAPTAA
ncbi:MAG: heavy metal sensor histidine kinase [Rubrivivax sp.]|nr:heavy metal sensor histidine kinase [Rubrivivax sp.]